MKKGFLVKITGNVQGVGFRANAKKQAELLDLAGFVQNQADGSVLIEAEGDESALQALLEWCRQGSQAATVNKVDYQEIKVQNYQGFSVR
jgi:acylphosphatase